MNRGGDDGREVDGSADAGGGEPRDRTGRREHVAAEDDVGRGSEALGDDGGTVGGGPGARGSADSEDAPDRWSATVPTDGDEEIPLPWTVADEVELETAVPEEFEDLRFVGPKTAAALRESAVDVVDIVRKRISYRDLTDRGVHPGVAAKIRREHSLSWSFDAEDGDLSRRSSQVRGLDDGERAWVAASSGWAAGEGESEAAAAETDGSGDAAGAEAAWRERTAGFEGEAADGARSEDEPSSPADGEAEWRTSVGKTAAPDEPTRNEEAAWRERAAGEPADDGARDSGPVDAEAAWREQSAPTPVTVLDGIDGDHAARLAEAGIRSVRRLATADPESVADALELDARRVERWCAAARAHSE